MTLTPGKLIMAKDYIHGPADPDVAAYIAAVETADGQGLEEEVKAAYTEFILGCISDGIWDAIKASCILSGARTLAGALVPLKGGAPTNFNFVTGDYNRKTGLVGDGSTKYLNSNRAGNADLQDDHHAAVWVTDLPTVTSLYISDRESGNPSPNAQSGVIYIAGGTNQFLSRGFDLGTAVTSPQQGLLGISRASSANASRFNGSIVENYTGTSLGTTSASFKVFARGDVSFFSDARLAFYSIGSNLDLAKLDTRISDFITAIGAAIP